MLGLQDEMCHINSFLYKSTDYSLPKPLRFDAARMWLSPCRHLLSSARAVIDGQLLSVHYANNLNDKLTMHMFSVGTTFSGSHDNSVYNEVD